MNQGCWSRTEFCVVPRHDRYGGVIHLHEPGNAAEPL